MDTENLSIRMRCVELAAQVSARIQNNNIDDIIAMSDRIFYHISVGGSPTESGVEGVTTTPQLPATRGNRRPVKADKTFAI